jgi:hypothetical protein
MGDDCLSEGITQQHQMDYRKTDTSRNKKKTFQAALDSTLLSCMV